MPRSLSSQLLRRPMNDLMPVAGGIQWLPQQAIGGGNDTQKDFGYAKLAKLVKGSAPAPPLFPAGIRFQKRVLPILRTLTSRFGSALWRVAFLPNSRSWDTAGSLALLNPTYGRALGAGASTAHKSSKPTPATGNAVLSGKRGAGIRMRPLWNVRRPKAIKISACDRKGGNTRRAAAFASEPPPPPSRHTQIRRKDHPPPRVLMRLANVFQHQLSRLPFRLVDVEPFAEVSRCELAWAL
ncbi:hypothetical protein BDK51DRAFT_32636 [Blyttiomyces helicus]|uniref:Uncharacterized protein n=1 Tax=Blyttiomyces helicus TaxID=388810 RepID=A0A4P9W0X4_9FUNG|nr:hypothetical protein BDK51DRAFT_32636 [Blyttiomyces helicus]|eukprot:RKO84985.1 hypothetical protein BDK51DRAFT_32636 [Blyttiomyces helicus]